MRPGHGAPRVLEGGPGLSVPTPPALRTHRTPLPGRRKDQDAGLLAGHGWAVASGINPGKEPMWSWCVPPSCAQAGVPSSQDGKRPGPLCVVGVQTGVGALGEISPGPSSPNALHTGHHVAISNDVVLHEMNVQPVHGRGFWNTSRSPQSRTHLPGPQGTDSLVAHSRPQQRWVGRSHSPGCHPRRAPPGTVGRAR